MDTEDLAVSSWAAREEDYVISPVLSDVVPLVYPGPGDHTLHISFPLSVHMGSLQKQESLSPHHCVFPTKAAF